jgi:CheY-like chemotaxis protein
MAGDGTEPADPEGTPPAPTVLVVEDDEDARYATAAVLARAGFQVLTAATGHDAVAILRQPFSAIDVTILDIRLPDCSGTDICGRLRELYPRLPVIVCTGGATPAEAEQLLRLGIHRYLRKPVSSEELVAAIRAALA